MNDNKGLNHVFRYRLLRTLLPLLGYTTEPIVTLTVVYKHPRGTRIGINSDQIWWNK